jgi:DNA invertase Pin-like site-specific DNA recombinase
MTAEEHRARTLAGIERARAAGRRLGRPRLLIPEQVRYALRGRAAGVTYAMLGRGLGCHRTTVYRAVTRA